MAAAGSKELRVIVSRWLRTVLVAGGWLVPELKLGHRCGSLAKGKKTVKKQ